MLALTGHDVIEQDFGRRVRKGYDPIAVDVFLEAVARQIDLLNLEVARSHASNEAALRLVTSAREVADSTMKQANLDADRVRTAADIEVAEILAGARNEAEHMLTSANEAATAQLAEAAGQVAQTERLLAKRIEAARTELGQVRDETSKHAEQLGNMAADILALLSGIDTNALDGIANVIDLRVESAK